MSFEYLRDMPKGDLNEHLIYHDVELKNWTDDEYHEVIQVLQSRNDVYSEFIQGWIRQLNSGL